MKLIKSVNLLEDQKLTKKLGNWSLLLMLVCAVLFCGVSFLLNNGRFSFEVTIPAMILSLILFVLLLVLHEAIHGLFFKSFNPTGKIKFGFKNGMAYAASPGSRYSRRQFSIICLAPFVAISLLLSLAYGLGLLPAFTFLMVAMLHGSCCIGDFYWVYLVAHAAPETLIEDTAVGIDFYANL